MSKGARISQAGFIPTTNRARMVRDLLLQNGGRMVTVTFIKADGTERTLTGNFGTVKAQSGANTVANQEKYVTMILPEKDDKGNPKRRNINCETVKRIKTNGAVVNFQ